MRGHVGLGVIPSAIPLAITHSTQAHTQKLTHTHQLLTCHGDMQISKHSLVTQIETHPHSLIYNAAKTRWV